LSVPVRGFAKALAAWREKPVRSRRPGPYVRGRSWRRCVQYPGRRL